MPYDGVDQDCDGADLLDVDGDGSPSPDDCDDVAPAIRPGATEVRGDGIDQDCDGQDLPGTVDGSQADEGFGSNILAFDGRLLVAAPFWRDGEGLAAGRIVEDGATLLAGAPGERLGITLGALSDGTVLVGKADALVTPTATLLAGPGVGRVLAVAGTRWVTSTATGAAGSDGTTLDWGAAPDALAILADGTIVGGFGRGEVALRVGTVAVSRAVAGDEAGRALAVGDVDGDGDEELVVGAPGSGSVYLLDPAALPASLTEVTTIRGEGGRFGAALLVLAGEGIRVGAPGEGLLAEGAVWSVPATGGVATRVSTGAAGEQLGTALAADASVFYLGAPGDPSSAGSVHIEDR